ncbi:MAG: AMP-binding protein, partial [Planctomycetes bacterium]|nr:AMP-binding protein [Planctomycetota bacterium]
PTPPGHEGEICIGGTGLARGYHKRDDLTAERFVRLPDQPDKRIYRTGDVGRALPDGRFECLGRRDHQVKIRGFRIELGEIEAVLTSVPSVVQVLVTANQREDGDPSLVAYWVGDADRDELIRAARRQLPAYMIPSAYVQLEAFPLNTSGKVDRHRLPSPQNCTVEAATVNRPRNDHETRIALIWRETLGLQDVPVDESFFHLGGTSALALKTILKIEAELGIDIPVQAFFEAPTVEGLAARFGTHYAPDTPIVARLHRGDDDKEPLFCLLGVHVYQDLALALRGDRTVIGIHVPFAHAPTQAPLNTLHQVAARYVEIIRKHQPSGPYNLLGFCFGGIVAYEAARQLEAQGESVHMVVVLDALLPSGVKVDWTLRLRNYSRRVLIGGPAEAAKLALRLGQRVRRRWGRLGWPRLNGEVGGKEELGFEGPAADAVVAEFAKTRTSLSTHLLMVRATGEDQTQWLQVADDYDWGGRARNVHIENMPCSHEELLQEPFVRHLAGAVSSVLGRAPLSADLSNHRKQARRP